MLMGSYFMASLKPKLIREHAALPQSSSSHQMIYQLYNPDAWSQLYREFASWLCVQVWGYRANTNVLGKYFIHRIPVTSLQPQKKINTKK